MLVLVYASSSSQDIAQYRSNSPIYTAHKLPLKETWNVECISRTRGGPTLVTSYTSTRDPDC